MIEVKCMGPVCVVERPEKLTGGMVGRKIHFSFDGAWDGLTRQAVLWTERCKRVMTLPLDNTAEIPAELRAVPARMLWVGVRGYDADMTLVIPTDHAELGEIVPGTEAVSAGEPPTLTQAQQLHQEIDVVAGKAQRAEDAATEALRQVEGADNAAVRAEAAAAQAQQAADGVHDVSQQVAQVQQYAADARTAAQQAADIAAGVQSVGEEVKLAQQAAADAQTAGQAATDAAVRAETAVEGAELFATGTGESVRLAQTAQKEAERLAGEAGQQASQAKQEANRAKQEADRAVQSGGAKTAAELAAEVPPGLVAEGNVQSVLGALAGLMTQVDALIGGGIHG